MRRILVRYRPVRVVGNVLRGREEVSGPPPPLGAFTASSRLPRPPQALTSILRIQRKISANEADQLGDLSTLADPSVVDQIKEKFASVPAK